MNAGIRARNAASQDGPPHRISKILSVVKLSNLVINSDWVLLTAIGQLSRLGRYIPFSTTFIIEFSATIFLDCLWQASMALRRCPPRPRKCGIDLRRESGADEPVADLPASGLSDQ